MSQPARMRCGKELAENPGGGAVESQPARMRCGKAPSQKGAACWSRRNPHECAVAKLLRKRELLASHVATRTNALRQNRAIVVPEPEAPKI